MGHQIFYAGLIVERIAGFLEDAHDRLSLAQVAPSTKEPALRALYRSIKVPNGLDTPSRPVNASLRLALIKALERNVNSGSRVLKLDTIVTPAHEISHILALCPSLKSLRLEIPPFNPFRRRSVRYDFATLPNIPSTVSHLSIHQGLLIHLTETTITQAFRTAIGLRSLSIHGTIAVIWMILASTAERTIVKLRLYIWGQEQSRILGLRYNELLSFTPHLTSLCLFTITYKQLESIRFPPTIQRLAFDLVSFKVVEKIIKYLATDDHWCPHLQRLVHFETIEHVAILYTTRGGRIRLRLFRELCRRAYLARKRQSFWQGKASEFERLANSITSLNPENLSTSPQVTSKRHTTIGNTLEPTERISS